VKIFRLLDRKPRDLPYEYGGVEVDRKPNHPAVHRSQFFSQRTIYCYNSSSAVR